MTPQNASAPTPELSDYDKARHALADLTTPSGMVLGDVIARVVLDSGAVVPAPTSEGGE